MRVILAGAGFEALLTFDTPLTPPEQALLAATVKGFRRAGTARNRGRGRLSAHLEDVERQDVTGAWYALFARRCAHDCCDLSTGTERACAGACHRRRPKQRCLGHIPAGQHGPGCGRAAGGSHRLPAPTWLWTNAPLSSTPACAISMPTRPTSKADVRCRRRCPGATRRMIPAPFSPATMRRCWREPASRRPTTWRKAVGGFVGGAGRGRIGDDAATTSRWYSSYRPRLQLALHTLRSRKAGRATRGDGSIFQIEALAAGQRFAGAILTHDRATAERIRTLLHEKTIFLGGSATAGYGRAVVERGDRRQRLGGSDGQVTDLAAGAAIDCHGAERHPAARRRRIAHTDLPAAGACHLPVMLRFAAKRTEAGGRVQPQMGLADAASAGAASRQCLCPARDGPRERRRTAAMDRCGDRRSANAPSTGWGASQSTGRTLQPTSLSAATARSNSTGGGRWT